jgi:hypothetical protein
MLPAKISIADWRLDRPINGSPGGKSGLPAMLLAMPQPGLDGLVFLPVCPL